MTGKEKIVHRVSVNTEQPMTVPKRGNFALRRSRLVRRRMRQIFYTAGLILSLAAISQASYGFLMETPYFMVKKPRIEGVSEPVRKEIAGLVTSFTKDNHNLLSIDAEKLQEQISRHPRLRDIRVEKIYPNQLVIRAVEREDAAIASTDNGFYLLDNEGHVMDKLDVADLQKLKYPYISGLRAEEVHEGEPVDSASLTKAINLLQILASRNKDLYKKISEIQIKSDEVSPLETLTAHLKSGLDIRFGDSNPVRKLPELETLLQKLTAEGIKPFKDLVYIDLQFDDMAFYMDRATAVDVKQHQYSEVQEEMRKAAEKYAKTHANDDKSDDDDESNSSHESADSDNESKPSAYSRRKTSTARSPRTAPARTQRTPQSYPGYQNYRQPSQQSYQQQYYRQQRYPQNRQAAPVYNMPANRRR